LEGDESLYEHFGKTDYYYMADKWEFREALKWIKDSRTVLEVGCGTGVFLDMVRKCFPEKRLVGLEYNQMASAIARNKGFDVRAQSIEELARGAEQFDAVCAFQVLEHVPNPKSFLKAIVGCLRKSGICVLTVPNPDGFTKFAINDFGNMPPHHITRWSRNVMRWVAVHHGLEITSLAEEPVAPYHREWYRLTHLVRVLSAAMGIRWGRIETGFAYKVFYYFCRLIDRAVPKSLWRYNRFPGHTLFAAFRAS
jgi:SAM-dependent methyltransferase